jgi:transcriptional regulator with XRE-family HTH domain
VRSPGKQSRPPLTAYRAAFGRSLRAIREQAGISQEALAHNIDMSRRYLSGIERGEANPTLDQIARLADGLGVEPRDLLPSRTEPPPH